MNKQEILTRFMEHGIPFNDFLGMEVAFLGEGVAEILLPHRPEFIGDPFRPALHGGVISALADTAGGLSVFTQADADKVASTVDLRIDYLRPGAVDQDIRARSHVIRAGNRVAAAQITVYQEDMEKPIAIGTGVYNLVTMKKAYIAELAKDLADKATD